MFQGPFVHDIDPIFATVGGVHLWWYGLSYTLGFLNAWYSLRRRRADLGLTPRDTLDLALLLAIGVLVGGRAVNVINASDFYLAHPSLIPAVWLGGMATHGLLIGGFAGVGLFCVVRRKPYRLIFDALAIPTAVILATGRVGNFIDGQILGAVTSVPWAVKFPDAEGFRHPVVLYDGLKNLLIIPAVLWVRRRGAPAGREAAVFLLLYASVRIYIDLFREYPLTVAGLPSGQAYNIALAVIGIAMLVRSLFRRKEDDPKVVRVSDFSGPRGGMWWRWMLFAACLIFPMAIPSDSLKDVPRTYAHRHPGVEYSKIYVRIP